MDKVSCGSCNCDGEGLSSPYCSSGLKLCGTSLTLMRGWSLEP